MRVTGPMLKVLAFMLDAPGYQAYGLEIMDATKLKSGTVYPLLHRLKEAGLLRSQPEGIDPVHEGRPARNYFVLTGHGVHEAHRVLLEHSSPRLAWSRP